MQLRCRHENFEVANHESGRRQQAGRQQIVVEHHAESETREAEKKGSPRVFRVRARCLRTTAVHAIYALARRVLATVCDTKHILP